MKQHHPDVDLERSNIATDINYAYAILRDNRKRAAHDQELKVCCQPLLAQLSPASQQALPTRRTYKITLGIAGAMLAMVGAIPENRSGLTLQAGIHGLTSVKAPNADVPVRVPYIDVDDVLHAADDWAYIQANGQAADHVTYSRYCFDQLSSSRQMDLFDRCVAFDKIAQVKLSSKAQIVPYFSELQTSGRLSGINARVFSNPRSAEARLKRVREMAVALTTPSPK